jgi:hypothetical protein
MKKKTTALKSDFFVVAHIKLLLSFCVVCIHILKKVEEVF